MIDWAPTKKDFEILDSLGLDKNPFQAVKDYSPLKTEQRWLLPEQQELYKKYIDDREGYIKDKDDYDDYYKKERKPIDKIRWEYLLKRKAWFITPLGWDNIAKNGGTVVDIGTGDGDTVQRLIDFTDAYWNKNNISDLKLHIVGLDLNESRVANAKNLVVSKNKNISFEFKQANLNEKQDYSSKEFDYALCTGVLEIIPDRFYKEFLAETLRIVGKGIYIEDLFERFPGGNPRDKLGKELLEYGFVTKKREIILSEPFDETGFKNKIKIWPCVLDQNLWLERQK